MNLEILLIPSALFRRADLSLCAIELKDVWIWKFFLSLLRSFGAWI